MTSLADGLPPEIAAQVNPRWRENEKQYWAVRDTLLAEYEGRWIAFADGQVIASGTRPVVVFHEAHLSGRAPYVARVGAEETPMRMRRASFAYDTTYGGEPLPLLDIEFRVISGQPGIRLDGVIADTGSDASALPWADCQAIGLNLTAGRPSRIFGVGGSTASVLTFLVYAWLDDAEHPCQLQADFGGTERILGRDILNQFDVLFRGPVGQVIVNP